MFQNWKSEPPLMRRKEQGANLPSAFSPQIDWIGLNFSIDFSLPALQTMAWWPNRTNKVKYFSFQVRPKTEVWEREPSDARSPPPLTYMGLSITNWKLRDKRKRQHRLFSWDNLWELEPWKFSNIFFFKNVLIYNQQKVQILNFFLFCLKIL